jgi:trk system potassium uptake protein TrkH
VITLLYLRHGQGVAAAIWRGVFHSVSAFCNAGFALHTDSLMGFQRDPLMLVVVAILIVLGGLGFAVLALPWLRTRRGRRVGLATQARLVLMATAVLVVGGAALLLLTEWNRSLAGLALHDRVVNALFQSVTTRTAGFNSVDLAALHPLSVLSMMVLMFIGASPGGTGGGIKTTTAVVLLSSILAIARGRHTAVLLGRRVPLETMYRSAAIATVAGLVVVGGTGLLLATQGDPFEVLLFEAVSAFGTVGLSLGATAHLDIVGKLVVAGLMLAGRVGPLSLALLLGRQRPSRVEYPEARIMVG